MPFPVYSYQFLVAVGVTAPVVYTCPVGYRTVVRDIDVYWGGGLIQGQFYFAGSLDQTIWSEHLNSDHGVSFQWRGRQVFNAGDIFSFRSDENVDVTISGYLLSLP